MAWPVGFLLVDKPAGLTSRDVVARVQRTVAPGLKRKRGAPRFRCGHAGTLDPMATGLLVVLVGAGTRLSHFLLGHDKTYEAVVRFGVETHTHDAEGEVVRTGPADVAAADLDAALVARLGIQLQVPPVVSAIKRDGRPLHRRVRDGEDVAPPEAREVRIDVLDRLGELTDGPDGTRDVALRVRCSSGTYIRSLARDLGDDLGSPAHLAALRRSSVGPFDVDDAVGDLDDAASLGEALRPLAAALPELPRLILDADEATAIRAGHQPADRWRERLETPPVPVAPGREPLWTMVDNAGALVAIGRLGPDPETPDSHEVLRTAAVFPAPEEAPCS